MTVKSTSVWDYFDCGSKVKKILMQDKSIKQTFLSAQQIARKFAECYPDDYTLISNNIIGIGTDKCSIFARYITNQLVNRIKKRELGDIEEKISFRTR